MTAFIGRADLVRHRREERRLRRRRRLGLARAPRPAPARARCTRARSASSAPASSSSPAPIARSSAGPLSGERAARSPVAQPADRGRQALAPARPPRRAAGRTAGRRPTATPPASSTSRARPSSSSCSLPRLGALAQRVRQRLRRCLGLPVVVEQRLVQAQELAASVRSSGKPSSARSRPSCSIQACLALQLEVVRRQPAPARRAKRLAHVGVAARPAPPSRCSYGVEEAPVTALTRKPRSAVSWSTIARCARRTARAPSV